MSGTAARLAWVRRTTGLLHASVCQGLSWSEDCQREDGGRHAQETMRPKVMAALATQDPVSYLHDRTCSAHLDRVAAPAGCPARDRHTAHMTSVLGTPEGNG